MKRSKRYPNCRGISISQQPQGKELEIKLCKDVCKECHNTKEGDLENFKYMTCWDSRDDNFWEIGYVRCRIANRVILIYDQHPENCLFELEHIIGLQNHETS